MVSFLSDITDNTDATYTVVILDDSSMGQARQYTVSPRHIRYSVFGGLGVVVLLVSLVFILTPIIELVPGRNIGDIRAAAQRGAMTIQRLQDSLAVQAQYMEQLQRLMSEVDLPETDGTGEGEDAEIAIAEGTAIAPPPENWTDHEQPAIPISSLPIPSSVPVVPVSAARGYVSSLRLPVRPPVEGYLTRGFSARGAHFAVDIAVASGTPVQSIGDGHVIFADWTNDGGHTLIVQHADGYASVYKHNERLLKRVGDRVRDREAIAISGNSGELTSGPHIHLEMWHNGLAQDPQQYFIQ